MIQNEAFAQAAKAKLEFVQEFVPFPASMTGWILGKNWESIRDIQEKSEVFKINLGSYALLS